MLQLFHHSIINLRALRVFVWHLLSLGYNSRWFSGLVDQLQTNYVIWLRVGGQGIDGTTISYFLRRQISPDVTRMAKKDYNSFSPKISTIVLSLLESEAKETVATESRQTMQSALTKAKKTN